MIKAILSGLFIITLCVFMVGAMGVTLVAAWSVGWPWAVAAIVLALASD